MKKVLLAIAAVALLSLSACGDGKSCYEFTTTATVLGVQTQGVSYSYCTEDEAITQKTLLTNSYTSCSFKKLSKSEENCKAQ